MGCACSSATGAMAPAPPSGARPVQQVQQQQQRSAAPAAKATKKTAAAAPTTPAADAHFAEFPGQDAFTGADAEVVEVPDAAAAKKVCLQKSYGGFALVDGKAYFRKESAEACIRALKVAANTNATFFAAPHEGRNFLSVKVMTYNVCEGKQRASGLGAAGGIVAAAKADIVGLQECQDVTELLHAAGMQDTFEHQQGPHGLATCFRAGVWSLVAEGGEQVAVDTAEAFESARSVLWTRLQHKASGKYLFFVNHQGALPVSSGGRGGTHKTASEILKSVKSNFVAGDHVVLAGDFRAAPESDLVKYLEMAYHRAFSGESESSTDHLFSSMKAVKTETLGAAGSDHAALAATFLAW